MHDPSISFCHNPNRFVRGKVAFDSRLLVLQMYEWSYSNYRRTGKALGVTSMTA